MQRVQVQATVTACKPSQVRSNTFYITGTTAEYGTIKWVTTAERRVGIIKQVQTQKLRAMHDLPRWEEV